MTPAGATFDAGGPLVDLLLTALDEAVRVLPEAGPLYPSLLMQSGDERTRRIVIAEDSVTALSQARAAAAQLGPEVSLCVLVYDGYVTRSGQRADAIWAEGHERGAPHSYLLYQQYRPASAGRPAQPVGKPTYVRQAAPLFRTG